MRRYKVEKLCTFKVVYKSVNPIEYKIVIIPLHLKKIKDTTHIANIIKKIFPNQNLISIYPQNKRAKRLTTNLRIRNTVKHNKYNPVNYSYVSTVTTPYVSTTDTSGYYSIWGA